MNYDGKLLARARDELDRIREDHAAERARRTAEAYAARPELRACDEELRAHMAALLRLTLSDGSDGAEKIARLREENLAVQQRRGALLRELGHGADWLDEIVSCKKCRDTGVFGGGVCDCLKRLYNAELTRDVGVLLQNGDESFEKFDLSLYDDRPLPGTSVVPRETMKKVLDNAKDFARRFPEGKGNLLFQGGTGLGKTFLSACVARAVAEKGFSVCYDTAAAVIGSFEAQKFSHDAEADARVRRMLSCDLMILDDLGTEMPTPMADSALYTLINTRLIEGKKTIISTNLSFDAMEKRYSAQICSRIRGEYRLLPFVGRDIRQLRK